MGHLVRIRSDQGTKMALERKPEGVRRRLRPRRRWYEDVEGDLREMRVAGWRSKALDLSLIHICL